MTTPVPDGKPLREEPSPRNKLVLPILLACFVIVAGIYSSWILFASFALLPSALIRTIDKSEKRIVSFSVSGLNITGTLLALQHSYRAYGPSPATGTLFEDWVNWVLPFGLAWMGVLLFMAFPAAYAVVMELTLQNKERRLKERQEALVKAWGQQLKRTTVPSPGRGDKSDKNDKDESA